MAITHFDKRQQDYVALVAQAKAKQSSPLSVNMTEKYAKPTQIQNQMGFSTVANKNPNHINILQSYNSSAMWKAVIPEWLYRPVFGKPRHIDVNTIRRLAKTPQIAMVINTIITEVANTPWEIQPKDPENFNQSHIDEVTAFFNHVSPNGECFNDIVRPFVQDMLELDSGVFVKAFAYSSYYEDKATGMWYLKPLGHSGRELVSIRAYDAGNFTKAPDSFGILPEQQAYWQYSWSTYATPISFARDELVYGIEFPQSTTGCYGRSAVEILTDIAQSLLYSIDWQKEFYDSNAIPQGVLSIIDANADTIDSFRNQWNSYLIQKDTFGNTRRYFHKAPVVNSEVKWTPITLGDTELKVLESQKWWLDIVIATFMATSSELGFTEKLHQATDLSQSEAFKRKAIKPKLDKIERLLNDFVVPEFGFDDIKFSYVRKDIVEERQKKEIAWKEIELGARVINDYRAEFGEDEDSKVAVPWGNEPFKFSAPNSSVGGKLDQMFQDVNPDKEMAQKPAAYKSYDIDGKALTTSSGGEGTRGNALVPVHLETRMGAILRKWLNGRKKQILEELNRQVDIKKKSLTDPVFKSIVERLGGFLTPSETTLGSVSMVVKEIYDNGVEDTEKRLDMNIGPDKRAMAEMQDMTFNDIKGMQDDVAKNLRREFYDGMQAGESTKELAKRVESVFDVGETRANTIARTTMTKINNEARMKAYKASGVVDEVQWITAGDSRVCPEHCKPKENKVYSIDDAPRPAIDTHPNCRCILVPYFEK